MALGPTDRIRAKLKAGDTLVRVLLAHPMHTGRVKNADDTVIPAEFIQDIRCWRNKEEVLTLKSGTGIAKNPYFSFQLAGGEMGDEIVIRWVDNLGKKRTVQTVVR
jgi:thiosulfate oxidation carrier complex protein SoxZ